MASGKILVTGAGGLLGGKTVDQLLEVVPASQLAAISRDPSKLKRFADKGVSVHKADYLDYESLLSAFQGVDKVMLIGAHAFTDRIKQHFNVITAAKQAGVKHIVYTSIQRREGSGVVLWDVTESDTFTEQAMRASGLAYTIMMQPAFLDSFHVYFGANVLEDGVRMPFGKGKTAPVTRDDLAAANVAVLTQNGHENKTYKLSGDEAFSFSEIAEILSEVKGKKVSSQNISEEEYLNWHAGKNAPEQLPQFRLAWVRTMNSGDFEETTGDMERLIGRKPTGFRDYVSLHYPPAA
jgi:NAD(P)H dehydrogenase (quinone)